MLENLNKIFVIDTSVLLYDKNCIEKLHGNDIVIPLIVLEEIDKFKSREGILGENARYINRFLDDVRSENNLHDGVYLEDLSMTIKVETKIRWDGLENLDKSCNDNVIIASCNLVNTDNLNRKVILITKDINLRVKCDAVNLKANDYYADYEFIQTDNLYSGCIEISVDSNLIDSVYSNNFITLNKLDSSISLNENQCVILKSLTEDSKSALCIKKFNSLNLVKSKGEIQNSLGIEAKNKEQIFALNLLMDENISLTTLTGIPGSGKTYLTLMTALKYIEKEKVKRIIFTRPIQTVGKDIGYLPGSLNEKMAPWLAPIVDNFRNQFGDLTYFDMMMEKGMIDIAPLSYIRGRSFNDAIIIVDEAQNATVHELKTVITRTGKNSKIILLGDIEQVDLAYVNKYSNGLTIVIEKLKEESLTGHVSFTKGYRSELANIAATKL
jgi:PhoH-like ATPase